MFFFKQKEKEHKQELQGQNRTIDYFAPIDPAYKEALILKRKFANLGLELNLDPGGLEMQTIKPDAKKGSIQ